MILPDQPPRDMRPYEPDKTDRASEPRRKSPTVGSPNGILVYEPERQDVPTFREHDPPGRRAERDRSVQHICHGDCRLVGLYHVAVAIADHEQHHEGEQSKCMDETQMRESVR